jgi:hypothetical protein
VTVNHPSPTMAGSIPPSPTKMLRWLELAYTADSKSAARKGVEGQSLLGAPTKKRN